MSIYAKLFAVPMTLYVDACDKKTAAALAEIAAFGATEALRKQFSGYIQDKVTTLITASDPAKVPKAKLPKKVYDRKKIESVFGKKGGIRQLNRAIDCVHP